MNKKIKNMANSTPHTKPKFMFPTPHQENSKIPTHPHEGNPPSTKCQLALKLGPDSESDMF